MKITDILDKLAEEICDEYCKWPEQYSGDDDGQDALIEEHCDNCPLTKYI